MKLSSRGINPRASGPLRLPSGAGPGGRSLPLHTLDDAQRALRLLTPRDFGLCSRGQAHL